MWHFCHRLLVKVMFFILNILLRMCVCLVRDIKLNVKCLLFLSLSSCVQLLYVKLSSAMICGKYWMSHDILGLRYWSTSQTKQVASIKLALSYFSTCKRVKHDNSVSICMSLCAWMGVLFQWCLMEKYKHDMLVYLVRIVTLVGWHHIDFHIFSRSKNRFKNSKGGVLHW